MGSIDHGIATPEESAAVGVVTALFLVWREGRLDWTLMDTAFPQTARTFSMILLIITAFMPDVTFAHGGEAQAMTGRVASLGLSAAGLLLALILFYVILAVFMDVLSMQELTISVAAPILTAVGIDPIWFGVFIVLMREPGMIMPAVGLNLHVAQGVRADGRFATWCAARPPAPSSC